MSDRLLWKHYSDLGYTEEETENILLDRASDQYDQEVDRQVEEEMRNHND